MTSNVQPSALPIRAHLANIKFVSDPERKTSTAGPDYFVIAYVDEQEVAKSEKKPEEPAPQWEWPDDYQFRFHPSSIIKVVVYRESRARIKNHFIGQHTAKVIELLKNDGTITLKDKISADIALKIKINLSLVSEGEDTFEDFMATVRADVSRLDSTARIPPGILALGRALQLTKTIMDMVADADSSHILKASWGVMSAVYTIIKQIEVQDDTVRDLAESLREMLGIANECPNLLLIKGTANVIEEIGRTSLNVTSLIHEYTKPTFMRRAFKSQATDDMKARIERCRKSCDDLKQKFNTRVNLNTNLQGAITQGIITEIKGVINNNNVNIQNTLKIIKNDHLAREIRQWLSAPDSSKNYNEAREKHQKDTFSWFLDGEWFQKLQDDAGFLWIKGTAGCGKTILCSSIIDRIIKLRKENAIIAYAYFFFDGRDSQNDSQLHDKLIRSLILQLSFQCDGIPEALVQLYGHGHQQPSTNALEATLCCIIDGLRLAYVIIDSLDECTEREKTLRWISHIVAAKMGNLRIVVSSRPERDISDHLQLLNLRSMDLVEEVNQDIATYLDLQLSLVKKWDEETRETVKSCLIERAQGMFRWIALQLTELKQCSNKHAVMKQLDSLPRGLYETYDRILLKISKDADRTDAKTFLRWLCFSIRPMTLIELSETVTVHFDTDNGPLYAPAHRYWDERDVLEKCSGLITEAEGRIKLAHFSIKEYLLSEHLCLGATPNFHLASEELCHSLISQTCLAYLLQLDTSDLIDENLAFPSPLAPYAAEHWIFHAKSGGIDISEPSWTLTLAKRLFVNGGHTFANWIRICDFDTGRYFRHHKPTRNNIAAPLYYASLTGLRRVTLHLLEYGNVNAVGGMYGNALQAASYKGHDAIVELLLENGADVNGKGGIYRNALQAASILGHEAIVKLLLDKEADVNAEGGIYGTPLQAASILGHMRIVKLLLEMGADANAQGGIYGNALQAASTLGHSAIVKLLLEKGADVDAQEGMHGNALWVASFKGDEAIVKLLLEKGADANAQTGVYGSALQVASILGHEAIVELLREKGANVNAPTLRVSPYFGCKAIVKLLEKGSSANVEGGIYGTALAALSKFGRKEVMKLLQEEADVNAQGGIHGSALRAASIMKHEAIVKLLEENGADMNADGGIIGIALQAASCKGYDAVTKLLLEYGADPSSLS